MNIKRYSALFFVFLLCLSPSNNSFASKKFALNDCIKESTDESGDKKYSVSMEAVDYFLDKISIHAKDYPVKFDSDKQRKEIEHELKSIVYMLETVLENYPTDQGILWRVGFAYSMEYNLDIPGSGEKCEKYFRELLSLNPEHPQGNFLFGAFLVGTATRQKESISYLQKAESLGYDDATYMLGFAFLALNEKEKALNYYEKYLKKYPNHKETKIIIRSIKENRVEYKKQ